MLKFKQFVNEILDSSFENPLYEATAGEVLKDQWERFIESIKDDEAQSIISKGSMLISRLPHNVGSDIINDQAYLTIYPTVIKVRSKIDGSRILEFKNSIKDLDRSFQGLIDSNSHNKFQQAAMIVFYLMDEKPESLSWAPKDSLKKETIALDGFNSLIKKIAYKDGSGTVKLVVAGSVSTSAEPHVVEVEHVDKISGTPRADFQFVDSQNTPFLYVSHKDGKDPKGFQQYSGMVKDKNIAEHPEVVSFVEKIKTFMNGVYTDQFAAGYAVPIKDPRLAALAMFGNEFGNEFGINNCHFLMQGQLILNPSSTVEGAFDINSSGHFVPSPQLTKVDLSSESMGEYWPHLYVRRSKNDAQFGLKGARFMILSGRSDIIPRAIDEYNKI
jgi:hypothetical protein